MRIAVGGGEERRKREEGEIKKRRKGRGGRERKGRGGRERKGERMTFLILIHLS